MERLEKRSKNVRRIIRSLTPEQAHQRMLRYVKSKGIRASKSSSARFGSDPQSFVEYTSDNSEGTPISHEVGHLLSVPEHMSANEYQQKLGRQGEFSKDRNFADEVAADTIQAGIERRAGISPSESKIMRHISDLKDRHAAVNRGHKRGKDRLNNIDEGLIGINEHGIMAPRNTVDAKINRRAAKAGQIKKSESKKHNWLGHAVVDPDAIADLETRAAVNEFGRKLPRHEAEDAAWKDYVREQHEKAAAHHLAGMKAASAGVNKEDAHKHWLLYDLHTKALGKNGVGPVPVEVEKRLAEQKPLYRFKSHPGDLYVLENPESLIRKSEPVEKMALKDNHSPEEPVEQKGGREIYDYTHLLPEKYRQTHALTVHDQPFLGRLTSVVEQRGQANPKMTYHVGSLDSLIREDIDSGHPYLYISHAKIGDPRHRGKGFGVALYEALMTHALKNHRVNMVSGDNHSTLAHRVHLALKRKHGLPYEADLDPDEVDSGPPGAYDDKYLPYEYALKSEQPMEKSERKRCRHKLGERRCMMKSADNYCRLHKRYHEDLDKVHGRKPKKLKKSSIPLFKFNDNHDASNGQFTSGGGSHKKAKLPHKSVDKKISKGDTKSAASYAAQYDDPHVTESSIMQQFPKEVQDKVQERLKEAAKLEGTDLKYKDSDGEYTPERKALHKQIIDDYFVDVEKFKPKDGQAPSLVILGGRGGSGKSAFTNGTLNEFDSDSYFHLDNDEIKGKLKPPYAGWNANQVHEESSYIMGKIMMKARALGLNVLIDGTLKSLSIEPAIKDFKKQGYDVEGHYMFLPRQTAAARAIGRFIKRGRLVPVQVILANTKNEENFDKLKPYFKKWSMYDNQSKEGPKLVGRSE